MQSFNWLNSSGSSSGTSSEKTDCSYSDTSFTTNKDKIITNIAKFSENLLNMKQVQFMFDIIPNLYTIIIKKINKLNINSSRTIAGGEFEYSY